MKDKTKHAIAGAGIALIMLIAFIFVHIPYNWDKGIVFVTITVVAMAKEIVYDKWLDRGTPDLYDALATIVGGWGITFLWGGVELILGIAEPLPNWM